MRAKFANGYGRCIQIYQDNAKPCSCRNDFGVEKEYRSLEWKIKMVNQPANLRDEVENEHRRKERFQDTSH